MIYWTVFWCLTQFVCHLLITKIAISPIFLCSEQILYLALVVNYTFPLSTTRVTGIVDGWYWHYLCTVSENSYCYYSWLGANGLATNLHLNQRWTCLLTHICVTRSWWVKTNPSKICPNLESCKTWFTHCNIYINGLEQDCSNSIALAMELLQSCTKPLVCRLKNCSQLLHTRQQHTCHARAKFQNDSFTDYNVTYKNIHEICTHHYDTHGCSAVSNHQPLNCLFNTLFRLRTMEALKLYICEGNLLVTGDFPHIGPTMWKELSCHGVGILLFSMISENDWYTHAKTWIPRLKHSDWHQFDIDLMRKTGIDELDSTVASVSTVWKPGG